MINLRPETKIRQIFYTSFGDYLLFSKNLLFKFVSKKKKLAADVNLSEDVYRQKKDMIISGGLNVYPRDIEEVFYENSKVQDACCIGIPHPTLPEVMKVGLPKGR